MPEPEVGAVEAEDNEAVEAKENKAVEAKDNEAVEGCGDGLGPVVKFAPVTAEDVKNINARISAAEKKSREKAKKAQEETLRRVDEQALAKQKLQELTVDVNAKVILVRQKIIERDEAMYRFSGGRIATVG